ncbi:MAG: tetratricopeptide repeat protein [Planctomycetota bacterium]|nr:tetratricopeptide repeat protein [Planctomycetota bacterium]
MKSMGLITVFSLGLALFQQDDSQEIDRLWQETQKAIQKSDHFTAEKQLSAILDKQPETSQAYYYRGRVRFQAGKIQASVADFDRHVKLSPQLKSRQWERGISLYYANQFEQGAQQFEIYQTYHDNDVENSAWRFLCVARSKNVEAARQNLLPIANDRRIPMMQIYEMYQGRLSPEKVIQAAEKLPANASQRNSAKFYAHLYIGLLYEVQGKKEESFKQIKLAREHKIGHYMWDVANVHQKLRVNPKEKNKP